MPDAPIDVSHDAWLPFSPPEIAAILLDTAVPWYVAGGWALDLFTGTPTRPHGDLEIAIPRARFSELRPHVAAFELFAIHAGVALPLTTEPPAACHQIWVRDRASHKFRVDIFLEPSDADDTWIYRRDPRLRLAYTDLIACRDGIPYGAPEVILLFKAKAARPKDEADFALILPNLPPPRRAWLSAALALAHPDHPWLSRLQA